jgi:hypothetical protein
MNYHWIDKTIEFIDQGKSIKLQGILTPAKVALK